MKVKAAKIRWDLGWANAPRLKLLVNELPPLHSLRYAFVQIGNGEDHGLYWAERGGYVSFYSYRGPSEGFGGRTFVLTLLDGTEKRLKGPWDCGAAYANRHFPHCIDVSITDEGETWKRGYTFYHAYVLVNLAQQVLEEFRPCIELVAGKAPAGEGQSGTDQNLIVSHGLLPYGGWAPSYDLRCKDGRAKPSLSEAEEWGDVPGATNTFLKLARVLGLETVESQEAFREWLNGPFRRDYEVEHGKHAAHRNFNGMWQAGIEQYRTLQRSQELCNT